jgi:hypothetical protein
LSLCKKVSNNDINRCNDYYYTQIVLLDEKITDINKCNKIINNNDKQYCQNIIKTRLEKNKEINIVNIVLENNEKSACNNISDPNKFNDCIFDEYTKKA